MPPRSIANSISETRSATAGSGPVLAPGAGDFRYRGSRMASPSAVQGADLGDRGVELGAAVAERVGVLGQALVQCRLEIDVRDHQAGGTGLGGHPAVDADD